MGKIVYILYHLILQKGQEQCPTIKNIVSEVKYMQIYAK